ncbi:hypothetical protein F511_27461 [Dorcoceras hygrometricum]|uniref:Uncharacterized protein n=1 Tax=Dorcoceras hygrometricum TaxID=472368 RepID=A0A2Z7B8J9_9LAMI|nr:hypothetical protein F511_27461 [Dorcoceras hygrometricum]
MQSPHTLVFKLLCSSELVCLSWSQLLLFCSELLSSVLSCFGTLLGSKLISQLVSFPASLFFDYGYLLVIFLHDGITRIHLTNLTSVIYPFFFGSSNHIFSDSAFTGEPAWVSLYCDMYMNSNLYLITVLSCCSPELLFLCCISLGVPPLFQFGHLLNSLQLYSNLFCYIRLIQLASVCYCICISLDLWRLIEYTLLLDFFFFYGAQDHVRLLKYFCLRISSSSSSSSFTINPSLS